MEGRGDGAKLRGQKLTWSSNGSAASAREDQDRQAPGHDLVEIRVHAETATFETRTGEIANPEPGEHLHARRRDLRRGRA
jgi:hypothetical protein